MVSLGVNMTSLTEAFPSLARHLSQRLRDEGRVELAEQLDQAVVQRVTFDELQMPDTSMCDRRTS